MLSRPMRSPIFFLVRTGAVYSSFISRNKSKWPYTQTFSEWNCGHLNPQILFCHQAIVFKVTKLQVLSCCTPSSSSSYAEPCLKTFWFRSMIVALSIHTHKSLGIWESLCIMNQRWFVCSLIILWLWICGSKLWITTTMEYYHVFVTSPKLQNNG